MPESIMLIEYDTNLRQSIALILQRAGYDVTATDDVDMAMDFVRSRNYHLILADLNLLELKAILLPKAPDIYPHIPILLLADQSFSEADMEEKLFRIHYLVKPIAPEQLLDSVETILGKKFPTHDSRELHRGSNQ